MNLIWFHYAVILSYGLDNHFRLSVRSSVAPTQLLCVGNIMQFTLDCISIANDGECSVCSLECETVCMCAFWWLWDSVPWVEIMCGWVCVHVKPWFINVGFSTTWAHSSSSPTAMPPEHTHMLPGPRTMRWGCRETGLNPY